jgi:Lon protease-like protein
MTPTEVALFPLPTVLFPGGHLPLRIFEQRYLDMVRDCARDGSEFGVCLITQEAEALTPSRTANTGTMAQIVDWYTLDDGLLGLTTTGKDRFSVEKTRQQDDGLIMATVSMLKEPEPCAVPESYFVLSQVVSRFMDKLSDRYPSYTPDQLDNAVWVGYRLSELLPLLAIEKQNLLETNDPVSRLQSLLEVLPRFQSDA